MNYVKCIRCNRNSKDEQKFWGCPRGGCEVESYNVLLEDEIKELAKREGKVITSLEIEDIPNTEWYLVWHDKGLKPNISSEKESWENSVKLPEEFSKFINENYERC